ncbi:MAG: hypothetical protein WBL63_19600 [Candidatus Acidiferrum sp.]
MIEGGGCHSGAQSAQPKDLQFINQRMIYDKIMAWETPVKDGMTAVKAALSDITAQIPKSRLPKARKAEIQVMANQAQDILNVVQKDGSWGVHAPTYTLKKVNEARLLTEGAKAALAEQTKTAAR